MYVISKKFAFSASHQLRGLPDPHPCARVHGHNYEVEVFLSAKDVDPVGFVVDYRKLDAFKRYIDETLDHQHLNEKLGFNPTAENLAKHLFHTVGVMWVNVVEVRVSETPKTCASYRP